ncbi:MAG TPA: hypothetical protein QGF66_05265 [SAR86 cluster bacterium]|jgi:hypothetical protein|nr:hypothetical protein [SAR86 cluster bacterium]|tara:strand:- start:1545 stop:2129 length:585 start_codon:yes stop_codon:yes gene_type:complete
MSISKKNYGRLIASIIFLTPILVLMTSSAFYYGGYSTEGSVNKGTLLEEPIQLNNLDLKVDTGPLANEFPGKWAIVQFVKGDCLENCWKTLYSSRQINIRLAKDSSRIVRYLISVGSNELSSSSASKIENEYPLLNLGTIKLDNTPSKVIERLKDSPYLLIDPLGNGILIYDSSLPSGELLQDIKKLLQNSKIG